VRCKAETRHADSMAQPVALGDFARTRR
jgi:hypothetical protein